jgi:hypothetical protein
VDLGLGDLSRYTFLTVGLWVVVVGVIAFSLVYAVGPARGKSAARMWADSSLGLALVGAVVDAIWALESNEVFRFVGVHGIGPILAMMASFALLFGILWYMAIRYTDGLKR